MPLQFKILSSLFMLWLVLAYGCNRSGAGKKDQQETLQAPDYRAIGKKAAAETQSVLAKNLVDAISKGGPEYAVEFCNTKAIPLTDSMAIHLNAVIKRVTDQPRNPANQANASEMDHLRLMKDKMSKGESPEPTLKEIDGKMVGYYPIVTKTMCLLCHGNKDSDISSSTLNKLNSLYPSDKATGYRENELRGLWVVEMRKEK